MKKVVFDLGGSIVMPGKFDTELIKQIKELLLKYSADHQFYVIVGGGQTARLYQAGAKEILEPAKVDLDWIGIQATRLNAMFMKAVFGDKAYDGLILDPNEIPQTDKPFVFGGGWKPGWSTDYVAALLAKNLEIDTVVNLTNIDYIFDKDPNKFDDAQKIEKTTWAEFKQMMGEEWIPGAKLPFDPVACKLAQEDGLKLITMNGNNLANLDKYLAGDEFVGSIIE
jgi:uridylate kinase